MDPVLLRHGAISPKLKTGEVISTGTEALRYLLRKSAKHMYHMLKESANLVTKTKMQQKLRLVAALSGHLDSHDGFLHKHLPFIRLEQHKHRSLSAEWTNEIVRQLMADVNQAQVMSEDKVPQFLRAKVSHNDITFFRETYYLVHSLTDARECTCSLREETTQVGYNVQVQLFFTRLIYFVSLWRAERGDLFDGSQGEAAEKTEEPEDTYQNCSAQNNDWSDKRVEQLIKSSVDELQDATVPSARARNVMSEMMHDQTLGNMTALRPDGTNMTANLLEVFSCCNDGTAKWDEKYEKPGSMYKWWEDASMWDRHKTPHLLYGSKDSSNWCPRTLNYVYTLEMFKHKMLKKVAKKYLKAIEASAQSKVATRTHTHPVA